MAKVKKDPVLGDGCGWVNGYEGRYSVDRLGNVFSHVREPLGKPLQGALIYCRKKNMSTYRVVLLSSIDGVTETRYVHRLVAETLIPNDDPENKTCVNHIDHMKCNNRADNLEWVTYQENTIKARENKEFKYKNKFGDPWERDPIIDRYIRYGDIPDGLSKARLEKEVNEEDFDRNYIPYEIRNAPSRRNLSYLDRWVNILCIFGGIQAGKPLLEISKATQMDFTTISRYKSGDRGGSLKPFYDKFINNHRYVNPHLAKIKELYNGT